MITLHRIAAKTKPRQKEHRSDAEYTIRLNQGESVQKNQITGQNHGKSKASLASFY